MKVYALYKGEELLATGTMYQIAHKMKVKLDTIQYYNTPAYKNRVARRKNGRFEKQRCLVLLEDD